MNFNELNLRQEILRAISELGYETATAIQSRSIPCILNGQDVTGRSSTGTGKTAAFGLPIVQRISEKPERSSVLILAPTRELAVQITGEIRKYAKYLPDISTACLYGGQPMDGQIRALKKARIVVGTPGRVMDHIRRRTLKLNNLKTVVLDEADEMLNMGFIDDIRTILENAPKERQTILFSATLSPEILNITQEFQTDTAFIQTVKKQKTADKIKQTFYYIPAAQKTDALMLLLEDMKPSKCLVFCNTKKGVDELAEELSQRGYSALALHGDLNQRQRNQVMKDFKSGRKKCLIATDVAARGIDVDDIEVVYNYDVPQELEAYVHRIGRTGRAGQEGVSCTLVCGKGQLRHLRQIEAYIQTDIQEEQLPSKEQIREKQLNKFSEELTEISAEDIPSYWVSMIEELTDNGVSSEIIAAYLCSKVYKTSRRLDSIEEVKSLSTDFSRDRKRDGNRGRSRSRNHDRNHDKYRNENHGKSFENNRSRNHNEKHDESHNKNHSKGSNKSFDRSHVRSRDLDRDGNFVNKRRSFKIRTKKNQ